MASPSVQRRVEGESLDLLCEAIGQFQHTRGPGDRWSFDVVLEPRLANPFIRAFMRIESRLLREDADLLELPGKDHRTDKQRKYDALILLVTSVAKARSSARLGTAPDAIGDPAP